MKLKKRLSAAAELVPEGARLLDIGTDHGFLPIALMERQRIQHGIAVDIGEGPLQRAREHIEAAGLSGEIETRRSDGFSEIAPGEADTAAILGMGGALIRRIVSEGNPREKGIRLLILGPQSEVPETRRFLLASGYEIERERLILEDGKYYALLRVRLEPQEPPHPYTEEELLLGGKLLPEDQATYEAFLRYRRTVVEGILEELSAAAASEERREELRHELTLIASALSAR